MRWIITPKFVARNAQDITDVLGWELLNLSEDERQRLPERRRIKAVEDLSFDCLLVKDRIDRPGRRAPLPAGVEPTLESLIDLLVLPVTLAGSPRFGDLLVQDAKQPGPDAGPSFEAWRRLNKGRERRLCDVLGLLRRRGLHRGLRGRIWLR